MGLLTIPYSFAQGDTYDVTKINANFAAVASVVNALDLDNLYTDSSVMCIHHNFIGNLVTATGYGEVKNVTGKTITMLGCSIRVPTIGAGETVTVQMQYSATRVAGSWIDMFTAGLAIPAASANVPLGVTAISAASVAANSYVRIYVTITGGVNTNIYVESFWKINLTN